MNPLKHMIGSDDCIAPLILEFMYLWFIDRKCFRFTVRSTATLFDISFPVIHSTPLSEDNLRIQLPADGFFPSKHEVCINAFLSDQFLMPALLDNASIIHHKYLVGIPHGL